MSYLGHIARCNQFTPHNFLPFLIGTTGVGWIGRQHTEALRAFPAVFEVGTEDVRLAAALDTPDARTEALEGVIDALCKQGLVSSIRGEAYAIKESWASPEFCRIDRVAAGFFGIRSWGVHLNGFVRQPDGSLSVWIARRASDRLIEPGKWDNMVAGGQPAGLTVAKNLLKEAMEEAGMPADIAATARPVSTVTYAMESSRGLKRDVLFCYDLDVPADFQPVNTDGEVERFELWPLEKVLTVVREEDTFKFNVPLTLIDFALRHGALTPDNEPDYEALVLGLRGLGRLDTTRVG